MAHRALLVALLSLPACSNRRPPREPVEPSPAWETKAGRQEAKLELAQVLVEGSRPEAALALIGQMRSEGMKGVELDVLQARALRRIGLLDDAEDLLKGVLEKHPRDSTANNELGILRMDRHDVAGAVLAFQAAVDAADDDALLANNLGFALLTAGRATEAVDVLRTALRLDSSNTRTRNNLGYALVAAGRDDEAYRVFRATGSEADARYNLGVGLELRGDTGEATRSYETAVARNPDHKAARTALARLTETSDDEESE